MFDVILCGERAKRLNEWVGVGVVSVCESVSEQVGEWASQPTTK